ncbi:hypothetical protein B0H19DRAFT_155919 [Mycena capillaripes]|nr:hypothetical protein B0H19DRAFT_155919 [Mycena capillaripes]
MLDVTEVTNSSSILAVRAPFDNPDADVILRSSDGIDFGVHRIVLASASPFFHAMFGLPQGATDPEVPVLPMAETGVVLDRLLRFWYPGAEPTLMGMEPLDNLRETLELLLFKYDMSFVVSRGEDRLRSYMEEHPVSVFSLACRHGWENLARDAARSSLKHPLRSFDGIPPAQLKYTAGDTYHSLLQYHSQCAKVAVGVTGISWASLAMDSWFVCNNCSFQIIKLAAGHRAVREWFLLYLHDAAEVLASQPGARLDDPKLMYNVVKKMVGCEYCRKEGFEQLHAFITNKLQPKMAEEIAKVELKLVFN